MATQSVRQQATLAIPQERREPWKKVRDFFGTVAEAMGSCFGLGSLEYMDGTNPAGLSRHERTDVECDVLGISGPYR